MSTNVSLMARQMPGFPDNIRRLPLNAGRHELATPVSSQWSWGALLLVVTVHLVVFYWLLFGKVDIPQSEVQQAPMLVSLLPSPKPESAQPEAAPIVSQPKPEPKLEKMTPKPVQHAVAEPVVQEQVTEAVTKTGEPVEKVPHIEEQSAPESKPEPKPEPKIEPPRFGVSYLNNPQPLYPPISRRMGEQGRVLLKVLVNANGDAETVDLDTGSGFERLDQAAMDAVKKWRFIPAKRNNQPLSAYVLVPISFSLKH